ncbi:hypothetical protein THAOC_06616, partial [Thalassiosira oceanica]
MDRDSVIDPKSIYLKQLKHDVEENRSRSKFRRLSTEESAASVGQSESSEDDPPLHEGYWNWIQTCRLRIRSARAIDENGNVDWDNITPTPPTQAQPDQAEDKGDARPVIPSEMLNSVKAELAAMTARAGQISRGGGITAPSDEGSDQSTPIIGTESAKPSPANPADITSAAVAASNARMIRLSALRANNESSNKKLEAIGRQRKSVDEIRRRLPTATRDASKRNMTFPSASAKQATSDK